MDAFRDHPCTAHIPWYPILVSNIASHPSKTTVFYDGSCPLCLAEIGHYEKIDTARSLCFVDVSKPEFSEQDILDQKTAMARFHVLSSGGVLLSGATAFAEVWRGLSGWRWLAKFAALPGVIWMMEQAYRVFLVFRPALVKLFLVARRIRKN